ncbi:hypothetical protein BJ165DRAFT_1413791 [Panaeolus papilionaceus]|nr:hypothetical protein BJ165DRAFT_1413791 [Panaeolus papilionaceus]
MNADHEEAVEFAKISKRENRVYVGNLSYDVKYRDLMEFMRGAGEVLFVEVLVTPTGVPKGCGIVEFASQEDAQRSIRELSEQPLLGRPVFIREDRFAGLSGPGFRAPGGLRSDNFNSAPAPYAGGGGGGGGFGSGPGYAEGEPNQQIMVRNLPWSTANEDLVELFETTGQVELAEILFEGTRSKGCGVVQFAQIPEAETAIAKFQGYVYGGRPLDVRFNDRWHTFTPSSAKGGQVAPMQADA